MRHFIAAATLLLATPLSAQTMTSVTVQEPFDDIEFAVESAILNMGLAIDFISYTGEMLERTRADVGSEVVLFSGATIYNFCSAAVSRKVLEADPANVMYCPYSIFVYELPETPGEVVIGHQTYPGASMAPANALLDEIIANATQ